MLRRCSLLTLASLVLSPAAAAAQSVQADEQEIVVTGNRDTDGQVRDFVSALTPSSSRGQLGRFEQDLCPAAMGVSAAQKIAIERRLRAVAKGAGIPIGKPDCTPNAILIVTKSKGPFLQELSRTRPEYFGALSSRDLRRLVQAPGPTASWQLEYKVDARGVPIPTDSLEPHVNKMTGTGSRITAADRPVFEAAALVVEGGALDGLTTTQLADYAAMRLFARTSPERLAGSAAPTILGILDAPMGSSVPLTLTEWDLSFLRGLYATSKNAYAGSQRSAIRKQIVEDLNRSNNEGEPARPTAPTQASPPR